MSSVTLALARHGPVRGTLGGRSFRPATWLFAVADGNATDLMLSCEYGSQLYAGRLDIATELSGTTNSTFNAAEWAQVTTTSASIADHWHLFEHGHHYLSYHDTTSPGTEIYVLRLEPDLSDVSSPVEVCAVSTTPQSSPGVCGPYPTVTSAAVTSSECMLSLNDHFMFASALGVYLVVCNQRSTQNELVVLELDEDLLAGSDVGPYAFTGTRGDGTAYPMEAGGSALAAPAGGAGRFSLVTQSSFDTATGTDSDLYCGETDATWVQPASPTRTISEVDSLGNDRFLMFPTLARFENGWSVVTYVRYSTLGAGFQGGDVVRQLLDEMGVPSGPAEVLVTATATRVAARPHVALWGDYLLTTWDEQVSTGTRCYMRVDRVTLS